MGGIFLKVWFDDPIEDGNTQVLTKRDQSIPVNLIANTFGFYMSCGQTELKWDSTSSFSD
jgi:hypothetical protein